MARHFDFFLLQSRAPETTPTTTTTPTSRSALNTPTTTPTMGNRAELGAGCPSLEGEVGEETSPGDCEGLEDVASVSLEQATSRWWQVTLAGLSPKHWASLVSVEAHLNTPAAVSRDARLTWLITAEDNEKGAVLVYISEYIQVRNLVRIFQTPEHECVY